MRSLIYTVLILFITAQTGLTSDEKEAQALLKTKLDAAIAVLQQKDLDPQKKNEQLVEIVTPLFDFRLMAKLSLGENTGPAFQKKKKMNSPIFLLNACERRISRKYPFIQMKKFSLKHLFKTRGKLEYRPK